MPFKVTQGHRFLYQSKARIDFLCVNNTNLHPILHRFQYIADHWSNFRCRQGSAVPVFNALVRGEPLNSGLRNLASRN